MRIPSAFSEGDERLYLPDGSIMAAKLHRLIFHHTRFSPGASAAGINFNLLLYRNNLKKRTIINILEIIPPFNVPPKTSIERKKVPQKSKNIDTSLFTLVSGEEHEEAIILLHGGPGVPEDIDPLMDYLARKYQVIYFHQRGTVNSPCPDEDYSMQRYMEDIDTIASHFGLRQFHLFGHSWGGLYAGIYAEKHPEKILSLFLCSPASGTGKQWLKMGLEVRKFNKKKSTFWEWMGMLQNSFLGTLGFNRGHRKFFRQFGINANKGHKIEGSTPLLPHLVRARQVNRTNKEILKHPKLKELSTPDFRITVTYGDDDIYGESINFVKERYPTGRFITIPNCSHMHWLHNEEVFYGVLREHFGW